MSGPPLMPTPGFKIAAVVDTFVRAIETGDFELSLQALDDRLKARAATRAAGAGSIWATTTRRICC